jgi:arginine N-succinyltransferase
MILAGLKRKQLDNMLVFRPVRFDDLPAIEHLAITAGNSMTTLPNNRDHLEQLINNTAQSLRNKVSLASKQSYHFVIEDSVTKEVLGISGIEACVGYTSPFYSYYCEQLEHHSQELQINNVIDTLSLNQDYEGASRLYTFFLTPDIDSKNDEGNALQLLSLSRLMFIGQQPKRFNNKFVLELQGLLTSDNESPFWQALGQHFFNMDFHRANYLSGINAKGFIADLMPKHPVYVPLLEKPAQQAIGQLRPDLNSIKELLMDQGFKHRHYISIFDAGPAFECLTANIAAINNQYHASVQLTNLYAQSDAKPALISNNKVKDFKAIIATIDITMSQQAQTVQLTTEQATCLGVTTGDRVYILALTQAEH